jgi:glycosyltransferase involved in cell wall biosynthesis
VLRDLRRIDFDVLHVLTLDMIAYPVALAASNRHPVVGPDIMGYTPRREGPRWERGGTTWAKDRIRFNVRKGLIRGAMDPMPIALSEYHAANIGELDPGVTPEVIPPGVASIFTPEESEDGQQGEFRGDRDSGDAPMRFLYVGDLSMYKGYDIFLDALAGLPERVDFHATVIGSGDPDVDRIEGLGLADSVTVEGFVPRSELPEYYRRADFYVMPSVDENGPNTVVEALACGTPVVATDKLGINEYAPEGAAIYVERTAAALSKGLIDAHERCEECAETALDHASEYRAERTVDALAGLYHEHRREA